MNPPPCGARRLRLACAWAALLSGAAAPRAHAQPAPVGYAADSLRTAAETLRFTPAAARQALAHGFVQFASEAVRAADSMLVRNRDYGIDYARGTVFLLAPPDSALAVQISYLYLPAPARQRFRAVEVVPRDEAVGAGGAVPERESAAPATRAGMPRDLGIPPALRLSGSKTIGVSFGRNRDATIDQSLRVEAAGELGDGLRVNAVLSDDNLPVLPEGNTEELGDLNKVFIELQGPVVGAVLGDYTFDRPASELTAMRRDLRGGELRLRLGGDHVSAGAGLAKGEFASVTFRGTEGKQGPYELLSARRLEFSTVVPGSERVYVDGTLQRRGDNQDYAIDYDRGELRFTSRRRISADSEIGVEFQVAAQRYRRETRAARYDGAVGGVRIQGFLLDEGDVRGKPVGNPYGPAEIAALEAAGDRSAIAPGIRAVAPGRGLYRRDVVDSTIVRYDPVNGDLEVDFYEAGRAQGAYDDSLDVRSGRRVFHFVGTGAGNFAIGRLLPPPSRHHLASAAFDAAPWRGAALRGEVSVSGFDTNQFSARDDADNTGEAMELWMDSGAWGAGRAGRLGVRAHAAQLSPHFRSPGRGRSAFYYKDWNAENDSLRDTERLLETTLHWGAGRRPAPAGPAPPGAPGPGPAARAPAALAEFEPWALDATVGRLDRGAALTTDRLQVDARLGLAADRALQFRWQGLDTARRVLGTDAGRTRAFRQARGLYRVGVLVPEVAVEADEFVRADIDSFARPSYRYLETRVRLRLREVGRTQAGVEFSRRDTDAQRSRTERDAGLDTWRAERRNDTWALDVVSRPAGGFAAEAGVSRRTNDPRGVSALPASRSDLAHALLSWSPRGRALRTEWRYEIAEEAVRTLQQVLVLAPDGHGDYDAEGRPVGKDQGLYDKVFRFTGEPEEVTAIESSLRFECGGFGTFGASQPDSSARWWRRNLAFTQSAAVKEQTRSDRRRELYLLVPSAYQTGATLFGSFQLRQEWSFLNASTRNALKLILDAQKDLDGRFQERAARARRTNATLRYDRTDTARWSLGGEAGGGSRDRTGELDGVIPGRASSGTLDVRLVRGLGRIAYRLSPAERLGFDVEWTQQRDAVSLVRQTLWALTPAASLAPARNVRVFASIAATRVQEEKSPGALPPFFFDAPGTKVAATFSGSYRLGQNLNLNLTYSGLRNTDKRTTYDVKAETRALF